MSLNKKKNVQPLKNEDKDSDLPILSKMSRFKIE